MVLLQVELPPDELEQLKVRAERRIYKVRRPNSDAQRGKSGGYRVIQFGISHWK